MPTSSPNLVLEPLSADAKDSKYTSFRVVNQENNQPLGVFKTDDIVQMRRFMASLGHKGKGLFSKPSESNEIAVEATHGLWDVIHPSEDELATRQKDYEQGPRKERMETISRSTDAPPTYTETLEQLPLGFYFPDNLNIQVEKVDFTYPGQAIPVFDPNATLPKVYRRPWHDSYRPPHGPPTFSPISIGYGAEIGLDDGIQALWNPTGRFYFFLDHINKVTFFEDPRPAFVPPPIVEKQQHRYGDRRREASLPQTICHDVQVIEHTARRARSKPHGHTLVACGVNGSRGIDGATGQTGTSGFSGISGGGWGSSGSRGGDGLPGGPGSYGTRGADATEASDVILNIWGTPDQLYASGTCEITANLGGVRCEEVLFVNCRGGDGGDGGHGGPGGAGGRGGMGGHGASGSPGMSSGSGPGGSGGPGGRGGDGGSGGAGGPGGNGGDGGHAGFGGQCVIQSQDPRLFMLLEVDCRAGVPGTAGAGGHGGSGGSGGSGGRGGSGGPGGSGGSYRDANGHTHSYSNGSSGPSGSSGFSGCDGTSGTSGQPGISGQLAPHGGVLWVVSSDSGSMHSQSGTRYDAQVTNLQIASGIDDGIFEPNERVIITGMLMINDGGLNLPSGAEALIPSTQTIKFEPIRYTIPEIPSGTSFVIPTTYYGRIFDEPPPNSPGPFVSKAEFIPRIELLGRPFERSFLKQTLVVQYPIKLAFLKCPENLGRGEVATLEIGVQNISRMPYGLCDGSGGKVDLRIHMDSRIIPVAAANIGMSTVPYTVTYDPNVRDSMYIQMQAIPPGETVVVSLTVQMESRAELFDRCLWQADVYLRDKLIEYNFAKIRVSPFYTPRNPPADILMVTSSLIGRREFVFWQTILESFNVTVDFWDTDRYNGFSVDSSTNTRHQVTWEGKYGGRMILFPHTDLQKLWGIDIVRHFHGVNHREGSLTEQNSSMVLFMPTTPHRIPQNNKYHDRGDMQMMRHLCFVDAPLQLEENAYAGIHMFTPGTFFISAQPFRSCEKKIIRQLEKNDPQQSCAVVSRQVNIQRTAMFRYKYGSVDCRRCPLLRSSKFLCVDGSGCTPVAMSYDDKCLGPAAQQVPLASNFGQVYIATLFGLPTQCKVALFRPPPEGASPLVSIDLVFDLPNGDSLRKIDLVVICVVQEIADEVLNCSGLAQRMEILVDAITSNPGAFVTSGRSIIRGMMLLQKELKSRKKKISNRNVGQACQRIETGRQQIISALTSSGVSSQDLPQLPRFKRLVDSQRFHFSHQHTVKDKRYNLVGQ